MKTVIFLSAIIISKCINSEVIDEMKFFIFFTLLGIFFLDFSKELKNK